MLEEDIALGNHALDLLGQWRALLTHAGRLEGQGQDRQYNEDDLAYLRDEREFVNVTLAELPRGDFAFTVLRNLFVSTWLKLHWEREKELISSIRDLSQALDLLRSQEENARRENDLGRAAEIMYGKIPKVEAQIKEAQKSLADFQKDRRMLKEEVDEEDIAEVTHGGIDLHD